MAVKQELKRSIDPIWHALQSTTPAERSGAFQRQLIRGSIVSWGDHTLWT